MGNIKSILSAFKYHNVIDIKVSDKYKDIKEADKLLLPGVGSFARAMQNIKIKELDKYLDEVVVEKQKPILGICLGMQLLTNSSEEDGGAEGLGYIEAQCKKFITESIKVPHVGFNQVNVNINSRIYQNFDIENDFYFTHSYKVESDKDINQSLCNYRDDFIASYEKDNIVGTQFHPELSQTNGLKLLKNFIKKF